jgi:hypothetical protein
MVQQHVLKQLPGIPNCICKPIIEYWEEISNNKHKTRLKYDKEVTGSTT